jgi:hypothetical protein
MARAGVPLELQGVPSNVLEVCCGCMLGRSCSHGAWSHLQSCVCGCSWINEQSQSCGLHSTNTHIGMRYTA